MALQLVSATTLTQNCRQEPNRPLANFPSNIWGDQFLSCPSNSLDIDDGMKHEDLKKEIKRMIMDDDDRTTKKLMDLIDTIQRLGVSYHFESEIKEILENIHKSYHDSNFEDGNDDPYTISLGFRLLRQHSYNISSDVFNKFKDSNGDFKGSLVSDIKGMLSFYEAAHLRVHGEDILDEALDFTTSHLESIATQSSSPVSKKVSRALKRPLRKSLTRIEASSYLSIYQEDPSHNELLLSFAKLDFNMLKQLHRKELCDITKWWKSLDVMHKLSFVRDRIVECYFWALGVYFEPEYFLARKIFTQIIALASIIDDIYDAYGTIEELELFTAAIERWDISALDQLPDYMKVCYGALLDVYIEIEKYMVHEGKSYCLDYVKEQMKNLVRAYILEAKWREKNHVPTMEEYMAVALPTTGFSLLATTSFMGMGDIANQEAFEWILKRPKIVKASSIICRLMDDIVTHQFEQKRGHVASAVECYMKQFETSEKETVKVFHKEISNAWNDMNEEFLEMNTVPMPLLERILNLARLMDLLYKDGDSYTVDTYFWSTLFFKPNTCDTTNLIQCKQYRIKTHRTQQDFYVVRQKTIAYVHDNYPLSV